jgi:hypothetical protein
MMTLLLGLAKSAFAEEEPGTVLDLFKKKWGGSRIQVGELLKIPEKIHG